MNLDHSRIDDNLYLDFIEKEFIHFFQSASQVKINLSSMGKDWETINRINPKAIEYVRDNKNIKVLNGFFSHMMPSIHPKLASANIGLGSYFHKNLFKDQLSDYGFVPEFDAYSAFIPIARNIWKGTIISNGIHLYDFRNSFNPKLNKEDKDKPFLKILGTDGRGSMNALISDDKNLRNSYLNMYREQISPEQHTKTIESLAKQKGTLTFLMDLETVMLNQVHFDNNEISPPRYDIWKAYNDQLTKINTEFVHLDDINIPEQEGTLVLPRDKKKWLTRTNSSDIYNKIEDIDLEKLTQYQFRTLLLAAGSDPISALYSAGETMTADSTFEGKPGKMIIKPNYNRILNAYRMLASIELKEDINEHMQDFPESSERILNLLHNICEKKY